MKNTPYSREMVLMATRYLPLIMLTRCWQDTPKIEYCQDTLMTNYIHRTSGSISLHDSNDLTQLWPRHAHSVTGACIVNERIEMLIVSFFTFETGLISIYQHVWKHCIILTWPKDVHETVPFMRIFTLYVYTKHIWVISVMPFCHAWQCFVDISWLHIINVIMKPRKIGIF